VCTVLDGEFKLLITSNASMQQGQGKTSIVIPLLALLLADGQTLVSSVLPSSLVNQSADSLRKLLQVREPCKFSMCSYWFLLD
jgi:hypothetical protein